MYSHLERNRSGSKWIEDGCSMIRWNATHTTCSCDHFTHFAVLMQQNPEEPVRTKFIRNCFSRETSLCDLMLTKYAVIVWTFS